MDGIHLRISLPVSKYEHNRWIKIIDYWRYKLTGTFSDKSIISKGTYLEKNHRQVILWGFTEGCVCVCVWGASGGSSTFSDASLLFMAIISVTAVPVERRSAQNVVITFRSAVGQRGWVDYTLFGMIKQRSWTLSRLWRTWCGAQGSQSAVQTDEYGDIHTAFGCNALSRGQRQCC